MLKKFLLITILALTMVLFSCLEKNPAAPEVYSLWSDTVSIIDTLYYGDSSGFQIRIGDLDGDTVTLDIEGLPVSQYSIETGGDTSVITVHLIDDSLQFDTMYVFAIIAAGNSTKDTLIIRDSILTLDTINSMWSSVLSANTIPESLYCGSTVMFQMSVGDSDGDPASITLDGLPASRYNITASGDTSFITLNLAGDSLTKDSLYTVRITATGENAADSLIQIYSMMVIDTNSLGGFRKLVEGMWWTEMQHDTTVNVKDSANVKTIIRDTLEHHKHCEVVDVFEWNGDTVYAVAVFDTIVNKDSLHKDTSLYIHTESSVEALLVLDLYGIDTTRVRLYNLPLTIGDSWQSFDPISIDTTASWIGLDFDVSLNFTGSAELTDTSYLAFSSSNYKCFTTINTTELTGLALLGEDFLNPLNPADTLLYAGDTVGVSTTEEQSENYICPDLALQIRSTGLKTVCDSNYAQNVVTHDTTRTIKFLTKYYDPRVGAVVADD